MTCTDVRYWPRASPWTEAAVRSSGLVRSFCRRSVIRFVASASERLRGREAAGATQRYGGPFCTRGCICVPPILIADFAPIHYDGGEWRRAAARCSRN